MKPMTITKHSAALPQLPARTPVAPWCQAMLCEWRLLRRNPLWLVLLFVVVALAGLALHFGSERVRAQATATRLAQADAQQRLDNLRERLASIEQGRQNAAPQWFRDPGNPLAAGRNAARVVAMPTTPVAMFGVGLSDLFPPYFKIGINPRDQYLFADELANPAHLLWGSFDLLFVFAYLLPLFLIAFSYDLLSGEREQGVWPLLLANAASPWRLLLARLAVRAGVPLALLLAVVLLGVAGQDAAWSAADHGRLALLLLLVLLWSAFWLALALWVNTWQRESSFNAVVLVLAWLLLMQLAPLAINALVAAIHPPPSRAELVLEARHLAVELEQARAQEGAAAGDQTRQRLALLQATDARVNEVFARHAAQLAAGRRLESLLAGWLPSPRFLIAANTLTGTGQWQWERFLADVDVFHRAWQTYFIERAERGERLRSTDYAALPVMQASTALAIDRRSGQDILGGSLLLALWTAVLLALARRRLACRQ